VQGPCRGCRHAPGRAGSSSRKSATPSSPRVSIDSLLDEFVARVAVLHLKDAGRPAHDFVPFGRGRIDNCGIIRRCATSGFDGFAVLELEVPDMEHCLTYLAEAYERFASCL